MGGHEQNASIFKGNVGVYVAGENQAAGRVEGL